MRGDAMVAVDVTDWATCMAQQLKTRIGSCSSQQQSMLQHLRLLWGLRNQEEVAVGWSQVAWPAVLLQLLLAVASGRSLVADQWIAE